MILVNNDFDLWRKEYMHPLLIGSNASNKAIFNSEVKRIEDAEDMIREFELNQHDTETDNMSLKTKENINTDEIAFDSHKRNGSGKIEEEKVPGHIDIFD